MSQLNSSVNKRIVRKGSLAIGGMMAIIYIFSFVSAIAKGHAG